MKTKELRISMLGIAFLFMMEAFAQTLISKNPGQDANPDALLEVRTMFANPQGFLMPSTTLDQINSNLSPRIMGSAYDNNGLLIYATDQFKFLYFRDDYDAFTTLNPWTLSLDGSELIYNPSTPFTVGVGTDNPDNTALLDVNGKIKGNSIQIGDYQLVPEATSLRSTNNFSVDGNLNVTNQVQVSSSESYSYTSPQTRYESIGPADFKMAGGTASQGFINSEGAISNLINDPGDPLFFTIVGPQVNLFVNTQAYAPIHLPHGAIVEEITIFYEDNGGAGLGSVRMQFNFFKCMNDGTSCEKQESANTSLFGSEVSITPTSELSVIDNENYNYHLSTLMAATEDLTASSIRHKIFSVKIRYTVTNPN